MDECICITFGGASGGYMCWEELGIIRLQVMVFN